MDESLASVWKRQFWQSIKAYDTEDKLDLYFYRPIGFLIAKISVFLKLTPTFLTLLGMVLGIVAGFLFFNNQSNFHLVCASALFVFAGILDSADGQLARLTGQFSPIGLVLDGICDNLVFAAAYIGSVCTLLPVYGGKIWILAFLAGFCHSAQSAILDFYNREYLFFGYGYQKDYWNPSLEDADQECAKASTKAEKIAWWFRRSWLVQQQRLTTRSLTVRLHWKSLLSTSRSLEFQALYRESNRFVLRLWRPLGANFHTMMIVLFALLRRFDLYLLVIDIILLSLWLFFVRIMQKSCDNRLLERLKISGIC